MGVPFHLGHYVEPRFQRINVNVIGQWRYCLLNIISLPSNRVFAASDVIAIRKWCIGWPIISPQCIINRLLYFRLLYLITQLVNAKSVGEIIGVARIEEGFIEYVIHGCPLGRLLWTAHC